MRHKTQNLITEIIGAIALGACSLAYYSGGLTNVIEKLHLGG
jgi:hypothetical protein